MKGPVPQNYTDMHYSKKLKDLSHPIERLEVFEERLGIRFEGLCIVQKRCWDLEGSPDDGWLDIEVNGEFHPKDGTEIKRSVDLVLNIYDCYDSSAKVVATRSTRISAKTFFGFETFSISADGIFLPKLFKVRLFPQAVPSYVDE